MIVPLPLLGVLFACEAGPLPPDRVGDNLARGRPYTLSPAPNYQHCTDAGDAVQLTDGRYTEGHFWTTQSTVGWQGAKPVLITVDLGSDRPIGGAGYSTAAGVAGVTWPVTIALFVSDDAQRWFGAGDLVALSASKGGPPASGYAVHRYTADGLQCHGRYLCFMVAGEGPYVFCDEVEVYSGPDSLRERARDVAPVSDLRTAYLADAASAAVRRDILADIEAVERTLEAPWVLTEMRQSLRRELDAARADLPGVRMAPDARATVPYNALHERVLRVRAATWRAERIKLCVWGCGPWDPLDHADGPKPFVRAAGVDLVMLKGEVRGSVFNITNPTDHQVRLRLTWRGAGGPERPSWLTVHEVAWTGVAGSRPVASALPEARLAGNGWEVAAPSGMTRQVWLSIDSSKAGTGTMSGRLEVTGDGLRATVPVRVRVSRLAMPSRLSLSLGGWDYTQSPTYGVTERNVDAVTAFLRRYHVDAPWAQAHVMPFGEHDASGKMIAPPGTSLMDRWIERWRGSRFFFVFAAFSPPGPRTSEKRRRLADWITFWVRHLEARGVKPSQLGLLLLDEPREPEHDAAVARYAEAIHKAQPEVRVFEDPIWPKPQQTTRELLDAADVLCPNRPMWVADRAAYEAVFLPYIRPGKALAFYSCSGPVRKLDPYSYHRLQAWDAFRYGAIHMGFWAFGDAGGGSSWNEFAAPGTGFCPQFLDADGCTTSKHMEAIREGLYDYETLRLLRDAADLADQAHTSAKAVGVARELLTEGVRRVTEGPGAGGMWWSDRKDRSVADATRTSAIEILEALTTR